MRTGEGGDLIGGGALVVSMYGVNSTRCVLAFCGRADSTGKPMEKFLAFTK
jgi:hypothetical protein